MKDLTEHLQRLVMREKFLVSLHGYEELENDGIMLSDIIDHMHEAVPIEEYPNYHKGPCCLFLLYDAQERPIHVLWGLAKGTDEPAVLITAYRPTPARWSEDFRRRRK